MTNRQLVPCPGLAARECDSLIDPALVPGELCSRCRRTQRAIERSRERRAIDDPNTKRRPK